MRRAQFYWRGAYGMVICSSNIASADEGGISFWIPGLYVVSGGRIYLRTRDRTRWFFARKKFSRRLIVESFIALRAHNHQNFRCSSERLG